MRLSRHERRALRRIARYLQREEPDLAAQLTDSESRRQPNYDAARRRRREDISRYGRVGRRKF
jgi:hypothetical protein